MALTARRVLGAVLLAGAYLPLHRLLDPLRAGPAGEATRASAEAAWGIGLYGTLIVLGVALVLGVLVPSLSAASLVARSGDVLTRPPGGLFAAALGLVAGGLALAIAAALYHQLPTSVDEMAQLLHARALASGSLTVPVPGPASAWSIQNGLVTPAGWASIYPPLHTLLLAVGLRLGGAWWVGPTVLGVATYLSALSFQELLGLRTGRVAGLILAISPFWLLLGATHLSHTTAAACLALVLWTGLRARGAGIGWTLAAGASVGAAVAARPWIGLVGSAAILTVIWWGERDHLAVRITAFVGGGLPFAATMFWWNDRLFGSPLRLGYSAAYGPAHGLGLHVDPWGNSYGATEALAYTGADLVQLGAHLLETPLPAVGLVGAALLMGLRGPATRPFLACVTGALAANALYWHHGVHMGPRMLFETVPAWVALFAASAAFLTGETLAGRRTRRVASWSVATAAVGAFVLAPGVVESAARSDVDLAYATLPRPPVDGPVLIFAHGSWSSRLVARLSAAGMRRDSVETALRRNDVCAVDRYARWRESDPSTRGAVAPVLDLRPLPGTPNHLTRTRLSDGNEVWTEPGTSLEGSCAREARADRRGVVELEPLLWQAPPLPGAQTIVARDMGPEINALTRAALGDPAVFMYAPLQGGSEPPRLIEYDAGIALLWGVPAGAAASPRGR